MNNKIQQYKINNITTIVYKHNDNEKGNEIICLMIRGKIIKKTNNYKFLKYVLKTSSDDLLEHILNKKNNYLHDVKKIITILHNAAIYGNILGLKYMLNDFKSNNSEENGMNYIKVLCIAINNASYDCVKYLVSKEVLKDEKIEIIINLISMISSLDTRIKTIIITELINRKYGRKLLCDNDGYLLNNLLGGN